MPQALKPLSLIHIGKGEIPPTPIRPHSQRFCDVALRVKFYYDCDVAKSLRMGPLVIFIRSLIHFYQITHRNNSFDKFGGKAEIDGTELVRSILAEKDYLEQLRRTCDYNVHV